MQKCIKPPVCSVHGLHRILSSYWVAYCYLMKKKSTKVQLFFISILEWIQFTKTEFVMFGIFTSTVF